MFAIVSLSGCITHKVEKPPSVQVEMPEMTVVSEPVPARTPLKIATWSPTKYDGRFTGMGFGYLTTFGNCLTMTMEGKEVITKDNTYLLVLADNSFSWDAAQEVLLFEGKSYKIGDEIYLGGAAFTYPNANITDQVKVNWIECGLDKGWLGG